jgi:hypothetical protein
MRGIWCCQVQPGHEAKSREAGPQIHALHPSALAAFKRFDHAFIGLIERVIGLIDAFNGLIEGVIELIQRVI